VLAIQNINRSLSALGDVISALQQRSKHVPFRNSKLTFLLEDVFTGDSKVMMLAMVSPASSNGQEVRCALLSGVHGRTRAHTGADRACVTMR
jgi:hypothetical protein